MPDHPRRQDLASHWMATGNCGGAVIICNGRHVAAALAPELHAESAETALPARERWHGCSSPAVSLDASHPWFAEVDAADQLANDHDVDALHYLPLQAGRVRELRQHRRRPQVGEGVKTGPQCQQAALRSLLRGERIPFVPGASSSRGFTTCLQCVPSP